MKILHIDPEKNWGGGEAQVAGLISYLIEKGHDNALLAHPRGRLFEYCRDLPLQLLPLGIRNDCDLRPVRSLRRLIRRENYDVVHLHTKRAHALSLWLPRGRERPKYVVTRRMDYPEKANWYTHTLYNRRVDGVVAISRTISDGLIAAGVDAQKIRLIHSGIDARRFDGSPAKAQGDLPAVGILAVLEERKGHRLFLEAAARLKRQGIRARYLIAGDGSLRNALEALTASLDLAAEVKFLGFVSDTPSFLSMLDVFVLPSSYEGLGVAALEAMAAGKPVVASRVGGLAESVIEGETGWLVSPHDADQLAAAIAKLIDDPALARRMGGAGRERVREHFSLEQMAAKNEAFYQELLAVSS